MVVVLKLFRPRAIRAIVIQPFNLLLARFRSAFTAATMSKPPNVAIHSVDNDADHQAAIRSALRKCLNTDRYSFVRLDDSAIRRRDPWMDNVELVVVCGSSSATPTCQELQSGRHDETVLEAFRKHWLRGGKFIDASESLDFIARLLMNQSSSTSIVLRNSSALIRSSTSGVILKSDVDNYQVSRMDLNDRLVCIRKADNVAGLQSAVTTDEGIVVVGTLTSPANQSDGGIVLFSQARFNVDNVESNLLFWQHLLMSRLGLDCSNSATTIKTTPSYLITSSKERSQLFHSAIRPHFDPGGTLAGSKLTLMSTLNAAASDIQHKIPFVTSCVDEDVVGFDRDAYFQQLNTRELGHVVIFGAVLPSTMDIINSYVAPHGLVIIAGRQTSGRGRSDHGWLSPEGCAMFSIHVRIPLSSEIGRRPSFLQHLAAMATVQGIRTLSGYENLNLRLKWPNDIYYGSNAKIGGIIVQSTMLDGMLHCNIGCGLNVSNGSPTVCVNDVIGADFPSLAKLKPEISIARTLTRLEHLLKEFESSSVDAILDQYYDLWLHQDARVNVMLPGDVGIPTRTAIVRGLDDDGFLQVQLLNEDAEGLRTLYSVQPDGNSFDMMHNLVIIRKSS